ncbi:hypothetical protein Y032_0142g2305 [Ancylostoma ceylanicum]|uniref:MAM domain-containing protein n=2 Tax=Ancylostoma ceylanicum TaxID=53326 RepID=A0A016T2K9_9BILA|nr:hypothetical protein Y032_0142g2305 [Ancylostoma ceylanicum]
MKLNYGKGSLIATFNFDLITPGMSYGPYAPRLGPYRSEGQRHPSYSDDYRSHGTQAQHDEILSVSSLNCATFAENCKWANTNEEELDWTTLQALPDSERYLPALGTETYPDSAAGALVSNARPGWEGGQLISDPLPCLPSGIRITATAWRSQTAPVPEQPKLQVCSKNVNEVKSPLVNCNQFDISNGVPVTVDVPPPSDPNQPAQVLFYGNNFVFQQGGAIFLQDIFAQGSLECREKTPDSHPVLIEENLQGLDEPPIQEQTPVKKTQDVSKPLKVMEGLSSLEELSELESLQKKPTNTMGFADVSNRESGKDDSLSNVDAVLFPALPTSSHSTPKSAQHILYETCLALSCNPSDLSCKFWRSSGKNRWEIGTPGRATNPLTGVHQAPESAQKFLVAPFMDSHVNKYTLVSESVSIPSTDSVFFCFDEYFATQGLSLAVCTEQMDCFYKKTAVVLGDSIYENKKWNTRCVKLRPGTYEVYIRYLTRWCLFVSNSRIVICFELSTLRVARYYDFFEKSTVCITQSFSFFE